MRICSPFRARHDWKLKYFHGIFLAVQKLRLSSGTFVKMLCTSIPASPIFHPYVLPFYHTNLVYDQSCYACCSEELNVTEEEMGHGVWFLEDNMYSQLERLWQQESGATVRFREFCGRSDEYVAIKNPSTHSP